MAVMVLISLMLSIGCARQYGQAGMFSEEGRYSRLKSKAIQAYGKENYEKMEKLFLRAKEMVPSQPDTAYALAVAYGRSGKVEEFWKVLEEAVDRGYDLRWQAEEEFAFKKYREEQKFKDLLERMDKNADEHCVVVQKSTMLPPADAAQSFKTLAMLQQAFDAEEQSTRSELWKMTRVEREARDNEMVAKKIVALRRYINEHGQASDLQDAHVALIKSWKELAGWSSIWRKDISENLIDTIDEFLGSYPDSSQKKEYEFYRIEAVLRGVAGPDEACFDWEDAPSLNYSEAIPLMDKFIADDDSGHWVARAIALKALCLYEADPDDLEAGKEAYEFYIQKPRIPDGEKISFDYEMDFSLRPYKYLIKGAPEIAGATLDGRSMSLSGLRGDVVLLDFWSPG